MAKYPINIWNQLELNNNDLRYNLNSQKSKLNFFLKSAISILNATSMSSNGYSYPYTQGGVAAGPGSKAKESFAIANQQMDNILTGKVLTLDGVFKRMVKVNNMQRYEFDIYTANPQDYLNQTNFIGNNGIPDGLGNNLFTRSNQRIN